MIFGGNKKRIEELEVENANLKKWVEYFKGLDAVQLSQAGAKSRAEVEALTQHIAVARAELAAVQSRIVETDEIALLQEVGIYRYRHPLDTAVAYQERLKTTKEAITSLAKIGAVVAAQGWTVNNSRTEGAKMTRDLSKLMLRAYNADRQSSQNLTTSLAGFGNSTIGKGPIDYRETRKDCPDSDH